MELAQSSGHGDGATLFGESCCPLKANEDICFKCCFCTYVTRDQRRIMSHLVSHGGEQLKFLRPFMSSGSRFKVHSETQHTGDKLLKCNLYPQALAQNTNLADCNQAETSKKQYRCKLCQQAFTRNSHLTIHNRTHTGEKPFKCNLCPQAFARKSGLTSHIIAHATGKRYKFKQCP